tara:strand:- start:1369 stop:1515 length:147 start_codon:yes stop_codon:yes gene_type:complete
MLSCRGKASTVTRQGNGKNGDNDQRIDVKERSANKKAQRQQQTPGGER